MKTISIERARSPLTFFVLVFALSLPFWLAGALTIIVWLYNNTGRSVFVATLFHTIMNLTWQLFPINGSYYDPRVTGLITAMVELVVVIVWGPHEGRLRSFGCDKQCQKE